MQVLSLDNSGSHDRLALAALYSLNYEEAFDMDESLIPSLWQSKQMNFT